jgi:hypothetical protein
MAQITISDNAYQALVAAISERGLSPDDIIAVGLQTLHAQDQQRLPHPLSADEFAVEVLGMTPEDIAHADAEARRLYPEAFPPTTEIR